MIVRSDLVTHCAAMSRPSQNPFAAFAFSKGESNTAAPVVSRSPAAVLAGQMDNAAAISNSSKQLLTAAGAAVTRLIPPKRSRSNRAAAASSNDSAGKSSTPKCQRKAYTALTGIPQGLPEKLGSSPLRLMLVGHNPSEHAWHTGHYYSNPSNRMWRTLITTGIAPPGTTGCEADDSMPMAVGVGFTDVGSGQPGTDSSMFTPQDFQIWRSSFYTRLVAHVQQASSSIGCSCGQCGAPALVAFTGKRHYLELLNLDQDGQPLRGKARYASAAVQLGPQPAGQLPAGWPLPADRTEVWVLTSTSGAAPMTNEAREQPYRQLAQRLQELPWPRTPQLKCSRGI